MLPLLYPTHATEIDELLRLIVDELVETSPRAAVSFALTCRSLEEPTLSSLWKQQRSLANLVKVLPSHTWAHDEHGIGYIVSGYDFHAMTSDLNPPR